MSTVSSFGSRLSVPSGTWVFSGPITVTPLNLRAIPSENLSVRTVGATFTTALSAGVWPTRRAWADAGAVLTSANTSAATSDVFISSTPWQGRDDGVWRDAPVLYFELDREGRTLHC